VLRQAGIADKLANLGGHLGALRIGSQLASAADHSFQEFRGAVGPRDLDGFEDLLGYRTPRVGLDGLSPAGVEALVPAELPDRPGISAAAEPPTSTASGTTS